MLGVTISEAKPFLKWVGGKGRLLPQLEALFPSDFKNYFEPFVGGGAVFFALEHTGISHINDVNDDLITSYRLIKSDVEELILELKDIERIYHRLDEAAQQAYYYERRTEYNSLSSGIRKTVLLIFLNRTCFNGLYRENRKGEFNVPFGKSINPTICNEKNLRAVSKLLQRTVITNQSYNKAVSEAKSGDFIYFDPPYLPLNSTSSFTAYHEDDFGIQDQIELRDLFVELDKRGCYVMLSNSSNPIISDLYKDYRQEEVYAARSINATASGRGKIQELVILNY